MQLRLESAARHGALDRAAYEKLLASWARWAAAATAAVLVAFGLMVIQPDLPGF